MELNDAMYNNPIIGHIFNDIEKQLKMKHPVKEEKNKNEKKKSRKRKKTDVCPTDDSRAIAFTKTKDLADSFRLDKARRSFLLKDKRNVTELITTVKHINKQGHRDFANYHCEKVG